MNDRSVHAVARAMELAGLAATCLLLSPTWGWWGPIAGVVLLAGANGLRRWWAAHQAAGAPPHPWVNRRTAVVIGLVAVAIGATLVVVPVRSVLWFDRNSYHADRELGHLMNAVEKARPESQYSEETLATMNAMLWAWELGTPQPHGPIWPPRYQAAWADRPGSRMSLGGGNWLEGDDIAWPLVFAEQGFILLIGGFLLAFVVRRERRRGAAA